MTVPAQERPRSLVSPAGRRPDLTRALGVAFALLLAGGVVGRLALYALKIRAGEPDSYLTGDWLINYGGGFVRRGLFGEIALRAGDLISVSPVWIAFVVPAAATLWLVAIVIHWFFQTDRDPNWLLLLLSPAFVLMFWVLDGFHILRKEILAFVALALLIGASHPGTRTGLRVVIAFALFTFAALSHELTLFVSPFFLYALFLIERRRGWPRSATLAWGAAIVVVCGITAATSFLKRGDLDTAAHVCVAIMARGLSSRLCDGSITWLTQDFDSILNVMALKYRQWGYHGYLFLLLLALVPLFVSGWANRHWRLLVIGILTVAPLFVIGHDYGRWINVLVVPCTLLALSEGVVERRPLPAMPFLLVVGFVWAWSLPHFNDPFGGFSLFRLITSAIGNVIKFVL
jgi:hypothetical protein